MENTDKLDIVNPLIDVYLTTTLSDKGNDILRDMEELAAREDFPIVGPQVGRLLQVIATVRNPKIIFELGSGYGYSTFWFASAIEQGGKVHHTDSDEKNTRRARKYLERGGLIDKVAFHTGDAIESFVASGVRPDILFMDIDKEQYPAAYRAFRDRLDSGAMLIVDNMLWDGRVVQTGTHAEDTQGVLEFTDLIMNDKDFVSTIVPVRDGVLVSVRK